MRSLAKVPFSATVTRRGSKLALPPRSLRFCSHSPNWRASSMQTQPYVQASIAQDLDLAAVFDYALAANRKAQVTSYLSGRDTCASALYTVAKYITKPHVPCCWDDPVVAVVASSSKATRRAAAAGQRHCYRCVHPGCHNKIVASHAGDGDWKLEPAESRYSVDHSGYRIVFHPQEHQTATKSHVSTALARLDARDGAWLAQINAGRQRRGQETFSEHDVASLLQKLLTFKLVSMA
jgi:hypothetical protein